MNKFDLMSKVTVGDLTKEQKLLLIELILRADDDGVSWPSVQRLCQVLGITHEKNFKGVEHYLEGYVTKGKRGRKNFYTLNTPAVEGVSVADVTIKHTPPLNDAPAVEGANTPAVADNTPALADNTPAVEGANSSLNNTRDSSRDSSGNGSADASPSLTKKDAPTNPIPLPINGSRGDHYREVETTMEDNGIEQIKEDYTMEELEEIYKAHKFVEGTLKQSKDPDGALALFMDKGFKPGDDHTARAAWAREQANWDHDETIRAADSGWAS